MVAPRVQPHNVYSVLGWRYAGVNTTVGSDTRHYMLNLVTMQQHRGQLYPRRSNDPIMSTSPSTVPVASAPRRRHQDPFLPANADPAVKSSPGKQLTGG